MIGAQPCQPALDGCSVEDAHLAVFIGVRRGEVDLVVGDEVRQPTLYACGVKYSDLAVAVCVAQQLYAVG